ncbi:MAG: phosphatase PAP2 family protein [Phycisphaerales bacterium]|nr:phosphatase PAP2 family protein [Phycisphaerales bacterium]
MSRSRRVRRLLAITIAGIVGLVIVVMLDRALLHWAKAHGESFRKGELILLCRMGGYLPLWILAAVMLMLHDSRAACQRSLATCARGLKLIMATGFAGMLAALLKIIIRRERPDFDTVPALVNHFRAYSEQPLYGGGLGMPSSHAAVAFAGAFVVSRYFPATRPAMLIFAVGTGLSRVMALAHYPSDVFVAMFVGYAAMRLAWQVEHRVQVIENALASSRAASRTTGPEVRKP